MTPSYPSTFYIVHRCFIDGWGDLGDGPLLDADEAKEAILDSVALQASPEPSLHTIKVRLLNDAGHRDATEDVLNMCAAWLDDHYSDSPSEFPEAWAEWASEAMREAMADALRRDRAEDEADHAFRAMREEAA